VAPCQAGTKSPAILSPGFFLVAAKRPKKTVKPFGGASFLTHHAAGAKPKRTSIEKAPGIMTDSIKALPEGEERNRLFATLVNDRSRPLADRIKLLVDSIQGGALPMRAIHDAALPLVEAEAGANATAVECMLYSGWVGHQTEPDYLKALLPWARRLVALAPGNVAVYTRGAMLSLSAQSYEDALMFGLACTSTGHRQDAIVRCASMLARGDDALTLTAEGIGCVLPLSTRTTQMVEAALTHCSGQFTEMEELAYLKSRLPEGLRIGEVGGLVGNHSAFFLRFLKAASLRVVDGDPRAIPLLQRCLSANNPQNASTTSLELSWVVGPQAVDATAAPPRQTVDALFPEPVDFFKIDADGGEIELLDGAERSIGQHRPIVMIEVRPSTAKSVDDWFAARGYRAEKRIDRSSHMNVIYVPG
jgi:hypothetical protein